ncbi:trypsin-like serine protease [Photobacterium lutimaris]|uniref:Peptidase S1 domain-containing protein n=1 Tax=Photobacterium lutimaris TaxID=388278 RepID=A0A2T3ITU1_9GAMM|nr:trypsin-like serine protease [Photobacterium lutimaris]PSU31762.1 hypothetical protein C9I99_21500 [Photobacterium lutimaris]TDR72587.1 trypsin [Photobacterium lutimaris]
MLATMLLSLAAAAVPSQTNDDTTSSARDFQVNIQVGSHQPCSGTILNGQWILTSSRCTPAPDDINIDNYQIQVYQGFAGFDDDDLVYQGAVRSFDFITKPIDEQSLSDGNDLHYTLRKATVDNKVVPFLEDNPLMGNVDHLQQKISYGDQFLQDEVVLIRLFGNVPHGHSFVIPKAALLEEEYSPGTWEEISSSLLLNPAQSYSMISKGSESNDAVEVVVGRGELNVDCSAQVRKGFELWYSGDCPNDDYDWSELPVHLPEIPDSPVHLPAEPVDGSEADWPTEIAVQSDVAIVSHTKVIPSVSLLNSDLGASVHNENQLVGLVTNPAFGEEMAISVSHYLDFLVERVDQLVTPTSVQNIHFEPGDYFSVETINIQNLSDSDKTVNPTVVGSGHFAIENNVCPASIEPKEYCSFDVVFNTGQKWMDFDDIEMALVNINILNSISLIHAVVDPDGDIDIGPCPDGDCSIDPCLDGNCGSGPVPESSGGSTSPLLLFWLMSLMYFRRNR